MKLGHGFATLGCPLGFDFDDSNLSGCIVPEAGPQPFFRLINEAAIDRIAVNVSQLLNALFCRVHVEIVVTRLPEGPLCRPFGDGHLERFEGLAE